MKQRLIAETKYSIYQKNILSMSRLNGIMDFQNLPISKVFFRIFFVSGFRKNVQVHTVTFWPPPSWPASAGQGFPQRPVTVWTSTFFRNPDTKIILGNNPRKSRLVQKISVLIKIITHSITIKHFMR